MPCFANYIKGSIDESDIASEPSDHPHVAGVKRCEKCGGEVPKNCQRYLMCR